MTLFIGIPNKCFIQFPTNSMPKAHQKQKSSNHGVVSSESGPDWVVAALALVGVMLTLYLLLGRGEGLVGCPVGGGCDLVQRSRWSSFFGIPLAGFGAVLYGVILIAAFYVKTSSLRQIVVLLLSVMGLGISAYLSLVTWRELKVICPYCLVSLALIGTLAMYSAQRCAFSTSIWTGALGLILALGVAGLMHYQHAERGRIFAGPADPYLQGLATHLKTSGARFFGASWCPHCQEQKTLFGAAAKYLPYVECSPHGPRAPQATDCLAHNITGYPTWIVADKLYPKLLTVEQLARLSGYQARVKK
jgi:uncharacterized membrane protein